MLDAVAVNGKCSDCACRNPAAHHPAVALAEDIIPKRVGILCGRFSKALGAVLDLKLNQVSFSSWYKNDRMAIATPCIQARDFPVQ
ncbi:hypothetical protein [Ralstonia solanacearum]|uniref:hypothetical protein n=1 Tax=Ralstonia solanacearum TaxID=305 RepID=UPI001301782F|nr:hypothetical protein [Ralstonia solanacearum]